METYRLGIKLSTEIRIRNLDAEGNLVSEILTHNDFTNLAADVLATAMLRSGPSNVTWLYARYGGNTGSGQEGIIVPTDNDLKKTVRSDFIAAGGPKGGLWVPLLATPVQVSSDTSLYAGNRITYMFRIPFNISSGQTAGASFDPSTSYIGALGLAVSPNFDNDRTQDLIFSVLQYANFSPSPAPFLVPSGGQSAIDYTITFKA